MSAPDVYAKQLSKKNLGFPLWQPDPGENPAIEIADVGYTLKGAFIRLFNASKDSDDRTSNRLGVPDHYSPISVGEIQRDSPLPPDTIRSESVSGRNVGLDLAGGLPALVQAGGALSFRCEDQQGAILILGDFAYRQDALSKLRFLEYIRTFHQSWLAFANNPQNARGITIEDLILVTGCDKTSAWACAAFSDKSRDSSISFRAGQDIAAGSLVWGKWEESHSVDKHSGPRRLIPPDRHTPHVATITPSQQHQASPGPLLQRDSNQCVFLRGYRICDRKTFLMRKIGLAAKAQDGLDLALPNLTTSSRDKSMKDSGRDLKPTGRVNAQLGEDEIKRADLPILLSEAEGPDDWTFSRGTEQLDAFYQEEIELFLQLNFDKVPNLLDTMLHYILEASDAELAIAHDDDLSFFIEGHADVDDFGHWLRKHSPEIHVDSKVGMLETTYRVFLSDQKTPDLTHEVELIHDYTYACGNHANIYLAEWLGSSDNPQVVVRVPRKTSTSEKNKRQLRFLRHWYNLDHQNILPLYGVYTHPSSRLPATISPWMPYADVIKYLEDLERQKRPCSLLGRVNLLIGVASALKYLHNHTPNIIHCDIKGDKVLVSETSEAILGGFGKSRVVDDGDQESDVHTEGSLRWTAPELLLSSEVHETRGFSTMTDVYAFGCLVVQILTGRIPWSNIEADASVPVEVTRGQRPPFPDDTYLPIEIKHLLEICCSHNAQARPSMDQVVSSLSTYAQRIEARVPPPYSKDISSVQTLKPEHEYPDTPPPTFMQLSEDLSLEKAHQDQSLADAQARLGAMRSSANSDKQSTVSDILVSATQDKGKEIANSSEPQDRHHEEHRGRRRLEYAPLVPASNSHSTGPTRDSRSILTHQVKGKMKESTDPVGDLLNAEDFIACMRPIAFLNPLLDIVQRIIKSCQNIHANRIEAFQLQDRCRYLLVALKDRSKKIGEGEMAAMITECTVQLNHILAITSQWSSLLRWESFLRQESISEDIRACHGLLDRFCENFQIQSHLKLHLWLERFETARKEDSAARLIALQEIGSLDTGLTGARHQDVPPILKLLQTSLGSSEQDSLEHQGLEQALHHLSKNSGELLPDIDLHAGEVRRVGRFPTGGSATFDIWEGLWLGREKVAMKVLRSVHTSPETKKKFLHEVDIWREHCSADHGRYLVPFYGVCFDDGPYPSIVSPWMQNGDVSTYLKENRSVNRRDIIKGVAEGLSFLHNLRPKPISHGDIRGVNILIDDSGHPLLADFGLPKILEDITGVPFTQSKGVSECYRWFAPELCISPGLISTRSDVFAFAMTVVEIMTERPPFSQVRRTAEVLIRLQKGERPQRPNEPEVVERGLDDHLWGLLTCCWAGDPFDRPTIDEVLLEL